MHTMLVVSLALLIATGFPVKICLDALGPLGYPAFRRL